MQRRTVTTTTKDHWPLTLEVIEAPGRAIGVALCGHAMMCDRRTLDRPRGSGLGSTIAEAGFETWLLDLRGHGDSGHARGEADRVRYDDFVLYDIPTAVRTVQSHHPGLPVVVVGHSLAAHTTLAALSVDPTLPVRAVVSLAGNVWLPCTEPDLARRLKKRAILEIWAAVARILGRFPARRLRVGTEDVSLPTIRQFTDFARTDRWGSLDGRYDYRAGLADIVAPILNVTSRGDHLMCRPECARAFLAPARKVTERVVGDHPGDPQGIDHMGVVTDSRMAGIWREVARWMAEVCR